MQCSRSIGVLAALALFGSPARSEPSGAPSTSSPSAPTSQPTTHQQAPPQQTPNQEAHRVRAEPEPVVSDSTPRSAGIALRGIGLRTSTARTNTGAPPSARWSAGGDLVERGLGVLRVDFWSGRYFDELWIGYGSEGWRYQLAGQLAFGVTWLFGDTPSGDSHGLVARFAMRGHLRREGDVFSSEVRVPGGELGYNWTSGDRQLELVGHGGATLTGRFNPLDEERRLRGATYGGSLSFEWARLRLDADYSHVAATAELGPVLQARAHLCGLSVDRPQGRKARPPDTPTSRGEPWRPPPPSWALCLDFRGTQGRTGTTDGHLPLLESSRQVVGGLSVVIGELLHL